MVSGAISGRTRRREPAKPRFPKLSEMGQGRRTFRAAARADKMPRRCCAVQMASIHISVGNNRRWRHLPPWGPALWVQIEISNPRCRERRTFASAARRVELPRRCCFVGMPHLCICIETHAWLCHPTPHTPPGPSHMRTGRDLFRERRTYIATARLLELPSRSCSVVVRPIHISRGLDG